MDSGLTDAYLLTQSFVSQTPVTLQVEERALWGRSASSLGTDGAILESPALGSMLALPFTSCLTMGEVFRSLSLSFPICKMGMMRVTASELLGGL